MLAFEKYSRIYSNLFLEIRCLSFSQTSSSSVETPGFLVLKRESRLSSRCTHMTTFLSILSTSITTAIDFSTHGLEQPNWLINGRKNLILINIRSASSSMKNVGVHTYKNTFCRIYNTEQRLKNNSEDLLRIDQE